MAFSGYLWKLKTSFEKAIVDVYKKFYLPSYGNGSEIILCEGNVISISKLHSLVDANTEEFNGSSAAPGREIFLNVVDAEKRVKSCFGEKVNVEELDQEYIKLAPKISYLHCVGCKTENRGKKNTFERVLTCDMIKIIHKERKMCGEFENKLEETISNKNF